MLNEVRHEPEWLADRSLPPGPATGVRLEIRELHVNLVWPGEVVNSPVEVTVNGKDAEVINKIGWPGCPR